MYDIPAKEEGEETTPGFFQEINLQTRRGVAKKTIVCVGKATGKLFGHWGDVSDAFVLANLPLTVDPVSEVVVGGALNGFRNPENSKECIALIIFVTLCMFSNNSGLSKRNWDLAGRCMTALEMMQADGISLAQVRLEVFLSKATPEAMVVEALACDTFGHDSKSSTLSRSRFSRVAFIRDQMNDVTRARAVENLGWYQEELFTVRDMVGAQHLAAQAQVESAPVLARAVGAGDVA
jgi:hypothetical protein